MEILGVFGISSLKEAIDICSKYTCSNCSDYLICTINIGESTFDLVQRPFYLEHYLLQM